MNSRIAGREERNIASMLFIGSSDQQIYGEVESGFNTRAGD